MTGQPARIVAPSDAAIRRAVEILRDGGLVAFPTETVYGLGADALDRSAVQRIFAAKGRPANNPIIVHVADASMVDAVVADWPDRARRLAERFWPGPLTLVLPKQSDVPDEVTAGGATVGVRAPSHPVALALLREAAIPLAAPSANRSTELSPTTAEHVWHSLGDRVDLILDGGPCLGGIESTVLDLTADPPRILRPGMITPMDLQPVIGEVAMGPQAGAHRIMASPGLLPRHYSPRTPMVLAQDNGRDLVQERIARGERVGWLTWPAVADVAGAVVRRLPHDPIEYATGLYATLHELDRLGLEVIIVALPPDQPEWLAIRDRLRRAVG